MAIGDASPRFYVSVSSRDLTSFHLQTPNICSCATVSTRRLRWPEVLIKELVFALPEVHQRCALEAVLLTRIAQESNFLSVMTQAVEHFNAIQQKIAIPITNGQEHGCGNVV